MDTVTPAAERQRQPNGKTNYAEVVERWCQLPTDYGETNLGTDLLVLMLEKIGVALDQRSMGVSIHKAGKPGLRPDCLVYNDKKSSPVLVIEIKKRIQAIANLSSENPEAALSSENPEAALSSENLEAALSSEDFEAVCSQQPLYRAAVGYEDQRENGIKQYLDPANVKPEFLASYGLVFNGDFFQIWRRVDGIIFPITPLEKVTEKNFPNLLEELRKCIKNQPPAFVAAVWNRKGGSGKTTNTINIGATLALEQKRVLLIDLDPQRDLSHGIGIDQGITQIQMDELLERIDKRELSDASKQLNSLIQRKLIPTSDKKSFSLSILSIERDTLENIRNTSKQSIVIGQLIYIVNILRRNYDYILIDAAPVLDSLSQCTMYVCDGFLIPIDGENGIRHAKDICNKSIPEFRSKRRQMDLPYGPWNLGLVRSNWNITEDSVLDNAITRHIEACGLSRKLYRYRLKQYAQTEVASVKKIPVVCWQSSPITKLYKDLTNEVFFSANLIDH